MLVYTAYTGDQAAAPLPHVDPQRIPGLYRLRHRLQRTIGLETEPKPFELLSNEFVLVLE